MHHRERHGRGGPTARMKSVGLPIAGHDWNQYPSGLRIDEVSCWLDCRLRGRDVERRGPRRGVWRGLRDFACQLDHDVWIDSHDPMKLYPNHARQRNLRLKGQRGNLNPLTRLCG